ncbi:MAG: S41 family peptidase [Candidatus Melainabacteria bacterium HGW-Melainabacteria-1]|nr:MAG: S41 family peptidase [Candidatus Melainabacteria bacterium HGW-Melainabacteria-1]
MIKRFKKSAIVAGLMAASFTAGVTFQPVMAETGGFRVFLQVFDLIKDEYVDKVVDDQKLVTGAIEGMLSVLNDPYTRFISRDEFKQMNEERAGSFSGIGIQIGERDKKLTVIAPIEDTPAWKAGLKSGDEIQAINGQSTKEMTVDDAVKLIRGKEGTSVKLGIYRPETQKSMEVSVMRKQIENQVVKSKMLDKQLGYIRLTTFMQNNAPDKMRVAIDDLEKKGMKGLILDLRSNPGGLLPNAVEIGSLFVNKGPIVRIVDRNGGEEKLNPNGRMALETKTPMVVLIDGGSASASEILAGALKDNKRAQLIGTRTFGKGLVQTVHHLYDGSGVAITTNKYLTTNGTDINKKGIDPDIEVTIPKEILDQPYAESRDVQLQKAIQVLGSRLASQ